MSVALPLDGASAADGDLPTVVPYRDGPLILRGRFRLQDQDGNEIDAGRETVALCRCGKSGVKPFCDGSHRRARFRAGSGPARARVVAALRRADLAADPAADRDADGGQRGTTT